MKFTTVFLLYILAITRHSQGNYISTYYVAGINYLNVCVDLIAIT